MSRGYHLVASQAPPGEGSQPHPAEPAPRTGLHNIPADSGQLHRQGSTRGTARSAAENETRRVALASRVARWHIVLIVLTVLGLDYLAIHWGDEDIKCHSQSVDDSTFNSQMRWWALAILIPRLTILLVFRVARCKLSEGHEANTQHLLASDEKLLLRREIFANAIHNLPLCYYFVAYILGRRCYYARRYSAIWQMNKLFVQFYVPETVLLAAVGLVYLAASRRRQLQSPGERQRGIDLSDFGDGARGVCPVCQARNSDGGRRRFHAPVSASSSHPSNNSGVPVMDGTPAGEVDDRLMDDEECGKECVIYRARDSDKGSMAELPCGHAFDSRCLRSMTTNASSPVHQPPSSECGEVETKSAEPTQVDDGPE